MMISGQSAVSAASLSAAPNKTAKAAPDANSANAPSDVSNAGPAKKDFTTVAKDARASLDAVYQQRGKALDMHTSGKEWETIFAGLDRRALYAVASNAGGQFSKDEQGAADFLMGKQLERAQGIDADNPASVAASLNNMANGMKAGVKFLDTVSDEEKQSALWAVNRASMQHSYELVAAREGKEVENLDSDNPLAKLLKTALGAAKGDPARDRSEGRMDTLEGLKNQPWAKGFEAQIDQAFRESARQGSLLDRKV